MGTRRKDGIVGNANSRNPRIVGKTIFGNVAVITPGSIKSAVRIKLKEQKAQRGEKSRKKNTSGTKSRRQISFVKGGKRQN